MDYANGHAVTDTRCTLNICNINLFSMFHRAPEMEEYIKLVDSLSLTRHCDL